MLQKADNTQFQCLEHS